MKSQRQAILDYLTTHRRGLTTMDMMAKLGIASPTKRISELRQEGHNIVAIERKAKTRYGHTAKFLEYRLAK